MKKTTTLILLLFSIIIFAQIPAGYYDSATGTGYTLKTQLFQIINDVNDGLATEYTSIDNGYSALYNGYQTTDTDNFYENDNTVLDMYSENPSGTDPYNYNHNVGTCGTYTGENDCYNREHLMPQSVFGSASPMVADIHFVVPTDGYVNNRRSSYAFGEVTSPTWTSLNGSKVGPNTFGSYSGTVFEPIDEFKGDIARMLLYFATRYETQVSGWSHDMLNGTSDQVYADWFLALLIDWHNNDPVSTREIARNDACYTYQHNRNPFVDHPEWVANIWSGVVDTQAPTAPTNLVASNPTGSTIDLTWTAATDDTGVTAYDIYRDGINAYTTAGTNTSFIANGLAGETNYCFTIKARDAAGNTSAISNQDCATTLVGGGATGTCATETFENIPANSSSYTTRTWTGDNGLQWSATNARTDQTINNRALLLRNGVLTAPQTTSGIGDLTVTTQRIFTGGTGTYDVLVNGIIVGTVPYGDTAQTTTLTAINIENNVTISIALTAGGNTSDRIAFDDLSWACYSATAALNEFSMETVKIYPNPVRNGSFIIKSLDNGAVTLFDILGKRIKQTTITNELQEIDVTNLKRGIYFVRITSNNNTVVKKIKIE